MKIQQLPFGWLALGVSLLLYGSLVATSTTAEASPTLTFEQPVPFTDLDGNNIVAETGTYSVDNLVCSRIRLNSEGHVSLFLDAQARLGTGTYPTYRKETFL
jgi:hypothetical protein